MEVFNLKYDNGHRTIYTVRDLSTAEAVAVAHIAKHDHVNECEITLSSGSLSIVKKDGSKRMIDWREVDQYRKLTK